MDEPAIIFSFKPQCKPSTRSSKCSCPKEPGETGSSAASFVSGPHQLLRVMLVALARGNNAMKQGRCSQKIRPSRMGGFYTKARRVHLSSRASDDTPEASRKSLSPDISKSENLKPHPLQLLPRPLGVSILPRWTPLTEQEKQKELLDEDNRKEKTAILKKLNQEAYYADVHKMSFHGGKMWISPPQLIREERSLYFPNLSGKAIGESPPPFDTSMSQGRRRELLMQRGPHVPTYNGKGHTAQIAEGNVSIIAITNSQISQEHVKTWTRDVAEKWRSHERFRFIHVNLQQNPLRTFLVSMFASGLRQEVPEYFHQSYIISYDNVDYVRDAIGLENKFVGYVYLVDWAGRIRWAGCGGPWNGDASPTVSQVTAASEAVAGLAISDVAIKRPKEVPEGGPLGQVTEGLVQGLGEVERLERCLRVLMNRLDTLVKEGTVA